MATSSLSGIVQFGIFELDMRSRQLTRNGIRVRLPHQPIQVLCLLLERSGDVVSRDELRNLLWPADVFVDFDLGLNKTIQKLREALGDSPESPRFIETIPRIGYRFIGSVTIEAAVENPVRQTQSAPQQTAAGDLPSKPSIERRHKWIAVAGVATLVLVACIWLIVRVRSSDEPIHSLAVIPLDNLSGDPKQDYFADGMTDELITMLAKNSTLRIISRTSVMQYKGAHRPLPEIARGLDVDAILEGSVSRSNNQVHMTLQLIRAATDAHLWAESYDRDASDVSILPDEAAVAIAKRLHCSIASAKPARHVSPEAHDFYLHGQYLWTSGFDSKAGEFFKKAVALDPDYAAGWAGLSMSYGLSAVTGHADPTDALSQSESAAIRALELDDSLPQAHLAHGGAIFIARWDFERGLAEMLRAIELDPRYAEAYHMRALSLAEINRHDEAIRAQKMAAELDPIAKPWALARSYLFARQYDAAIDDARQRLESFPHDPRLLSIIASAYRGKGMFKDAAVADEQQFRAVGDEVSAAGIHRAFQQGGNKGVAAWRLKVLKEKREAHQYVSPVDEALLYAQLGDREKTIRLLEEGFRSHSPQMLMMQTNSAYDFLHSDPRYRSIVQRIGLPPAY